LTFTPQLTASMPTMTAASTDGLLANASAELRISNVHEIRACD
jgi:hypothetical protein